MVYLSTFNVLFNPVMKVINFQQFFGLSAC